MKYNSFISIPRTIAVLPLFLSGCELPSEVEAGNSTVEVQFASEAPAPEIPTPEAPGARPPAVCNPFGDQPSAERDAGLWGQLYYLVDGMPRYSRVADYISHGHHALVDLFFNKLDVPTRSFNRGFTMQDGKVLKTPDGDTLYEWFAIHFESVLSLASGEQAGRYQLALLSDDGSVMSINENGSGFTQLINNDGLTSTRLSCATRTVWMDQSTRLPVSIDYFQGPRHHIALVLLWRYLPGTVDGSDLSDVSCGVSGNEAFFDYNTSPSVPKQRWIDLLGRGWKVLSPENFRLPDRMIENPCAGQGPGVIGV